MKDTDPLGPILQLGTKALRDSAWDSQGGLGLALQTLTFRHPATMWNSQPWIKHPSFLYTTRGDLPKEGIQKASRLRWELPKLASRNCKGEGCVLNPTLQKVVNYQDHWRPWFSSSLCLLCPVFILTNISKLISGRFVVIFNLLLKVKYFCFLELLLACMVLVIVLLEKTNVFWWEVYPIVC